MPEMDKEVVETDEETTETIASDESEGSDEITYEQALAWKKKAEQLEKAEKRIVELKKQGKEKSVPSDEVYTKTDAMIDRFVLKNPDLEGYENDLKEYLKKGNTLEEARILVEHKDKTIQNRKKAEEMDVSSSEKTPKGTYTEAELESMSQDQYNRVMALAEQGKVTIR